MAKWLDVSMQNEEWDALPCKIRIASIDRFEFVDEEEVYAVVGALRYRVQWTRSQLDEFFAADAQGPPDYSELLGNIGSAVEDVRDQVDGLGVTLYELPEEMERVAKRSRIDDAL